MSGSIYGYGVSGLKRMTERRAQRLTEKTDAKMLEAADVLQRDTLRRQKKARYIVFMANLKNDKSRSCDLPIYFLFEVYKRE